ncbi:PAS domain-containing protein [Hymenobacter sp. H14-R3]|uniref:PAS domain-containing protein n=1 Tax=Hymenobacter sp. H14-R3 TaxID=3046308 RepID=UPI0024BA9AEA|nr:PAS domain-containing protein [Hymenobacter sp. H14-R3]MDJ0363998.1 PAS domain-containing protein [Hymenobacter sp. H14-R3]
MPAPALPVDYQALFRALPGSYLLLAADGTVLDNSDHHVAASMRTRESAVGRSIFEAFPSAPESQRQLFDSQEDVRRTRQPDTMLLLRYDLERPAAQGGGIEERYWQLTHYPLLDAQGEVQYLLQMPQDVTAQHRAALAAAEAQQQLAAEQECPRFMLDNLSVLIWTATPDGQRDYFNPRWLAFTGKAMAEELGEQWLGDLHPDDRARVRTQWAQVAASGTPYQVEYRLRRHDGQYCWLLSRAQPRRIAEGQVNLWVGGATDIHDQKMMVQEILSASEQQALLSEQAYQNYQLFENQRNTYQSLFMQAPALICILRGPEHRCEFVNTAYQARFPDRQLLGRPVAEALPEVVAQGIVQLLDNVLETGETFIGDELLVELPAPEGPAREAPASLHPAYFNFTYQRFSERGEVGGIMVFAFEVTELVNARKALE